MPRKGRKSLLSKGKSLARRLGKDLGQSKLAKVSKQPFTLNKKWY